MAGKTIDKSIKQGGKESPWLFNMMMVGVFKPLQGKWNEGKIGVRMRTGEGQQEECRVSHMIFADDCCLFAASKKEIRMIIADTTEELSRTDLRRLKPFRPWGL